MRHWADLIGRILFATYFLFLAIRNISRFKRVLAEWVEHGITWLPWYFLFVANTFLVLGITLLVLGYRSALGAAMLGIVLIAITLMFHDFWNYPIGPERQLESVMFFKNITILGALFVFAGRESGRYSIRKLLASTRS